MEAAGLVRLPRGGIVAHLIRQYALDKGALEISYMEQYFDEFRHKKTADEIVRRLQGREHLILLALAAGPDDSELMIPVSSRSGTNCFPMSATFNFTTW